MAHRGVCALNPTADPLGVNAIRPTRRFNVITIVDLAERDPSAAFAYVDASLPDARRAEWLAAVARGWARVDPDAALQWARSQEDHFLAYERAVYKGVTDVDPLRALALTTREGDTDAVYRAMVAAIDSDPARVAEMAEIGLGITQSIPRGRALDAVVARWSYYAPEDALRWLAANAERVPSRLFNPMAGIVGDPPPSRAPGLDPAFAAGFTEIVPKDVRANWIAKVGHVFALRDARASAAWAEQLREPADVRAAVAVVAPLLAATDAQAAIDLVTRDARDVDRNRALLVAIARQWAQRDPQAVVSWAQTLAELEGRTAIQDIGFSAWYHRDASAARDAVLAMPRGAERDVALGSIFVDSAMDGIDPRDPARPSPALDTVLMNAFASGRAREERVVELVEHIASWSPIGARRLIDSFITEPALRERAEGIVRRADR